MRKNNFEILLLVALSCYTQTVLVKKNTTSKYLNSAIMDLQKIAGKREFNFSKYLKRFEPRTVWEHLDKQRKYHGLQITDEQQTQLMCTLMDPADEILKLKVQNGDPKMVLDMSGRRGWTPPKGLNKYDKDRFYIRRRIYELMKQAIYQTRNKMVIMQIYREKYSFTALYRMGFLMNKADNAAKLFGMFSFRLFKGCLLSRENLGRLPIRDLMSGHERQLSHLFNLELLVDVIKKNDETCKEIFANQTSGRTAAFNNKFVS